MNHRSSTKTFVAETVELERIPLISSNAEDIHIYHDAIIDDDGDEDDYDNDYEGDDHDHDDEYDDDGDDACCTWKEYFTSYRFIELNVCFWPCLLIVLYLDYIYYQPRERPIPYEHLGMSGGIGIKTASSGTSTIKNNAGEDTREESLYSDPNTVWNLVNNEKFLGDTISSTECKLYALILPLMLQLFMVWFLWIIPRGSNPVATTTAVNNNNNSNNNNNNNNNKSGNNSNSIDIGLFHRWDAIHKTICVYSVGFGITEVITCSVKYYVGYLRPIFLDICQPYYDASSSDGEGGGGEFRCTDEYEAKGARISFPSNHASGSFCGMLLLSLYLEHCFRTIITHPTVATTKTFLRRKKLRRRQQQIQDHAKKGLQRLVSLFCYTPMLFAVFIAASRVVDNRHFPADVVGGAVLGASIASLVFNIWYVISL
jgi:membrane-associated phospholipid phosphatase